MSSVMSPIYSYFIYTPSRSLPPGLAHDGDRGGRGTGLLLALSRRYAIGLQLKSFSAERLSLVCPSVVVGVESPEMEPSTSEHWPASSKGSSSVRPDFADKPVHAWGNPTQL